MRATAGTDSAAARDALASLCEAYWYPLCACVRRQGHSPEDAQDLTQGFLTRLLGRHDFAAAQPARGRFRAFLPGSLKHYLINDGRDRRTLKRGGGRVLLSIEPLHRLRAAWARDGKAEKFDGLQAGLAGDPPADGDAGIARALGMTEGAVKVAAHRLKREFRRVLREEVADTVEEDGLVTREVTDLLRIIN